MKEISETGYWNAETAHLHHVHSKELSEWICTFLKRGGNTPIYDFGAGLGSYLKDLKNAGFNNLIGFEGDPPKNKVFDPILKQDLTIPFNLGQKGNILSLEVGEHIDAKYMNIYLDNLCLNCDKYLITSWAVRGQAGFGHVNCLNNDEILPLFEYRGFKLMEKETNEARALIQDYCHWFRNTLFILERV